MFIHATPNQELGHIIDEHGVRPAPSKDEAVKDFPSLCERSLPIFRARIFLPEELSHMSDLTVPLVNPTCKNVDFEWSDECKSATQTIKHSLVNYPVL